jgi:cellulose synthase/poly-beta-1,6-N-acetylglucosamine synthase-like glycosyltransferase
LRSSVNSALASDYQGELEIVIAVGPSQDRTREIADELARSDSRIVVVENPTGNTPHGLNAALRNTRHDIIVRIDGHSEIQKDYIRKAVETLDATGAVNVGGLMAAEGKTLFQTAVARAMSSPIGVGSARFHIGGSAGPTDTVYLGVFRRSALEAIGGYDESFIRAQDWEMNHRLRMNGGVIWFNPELKVIYRPRNTIKTLARQYFEYGRWRRAVSRRHKGTINFRYLAPPLNLLINLASVLLGTLLNPLFLIPSASYVLVITLASMRVGKKVKEKLLLPIVLIVMHFSWGFGFISSPKSLLRR